MTARRHYAKPKPRQPISSKLLARLLGFGLVFIAMLIENAAAFVHSPWPTLLGVLIFGSIVSAVLRAIIVSWRGEILD